MTGKCSGYDGITTNLIKEIGKSLVEPLTLSMNNFISIGVVLDCMQMAKVVPVFKHGVFSNFYIFFPSRGEEFHKLLFTVVNHTTLTQTYW